MLKKNLLVLGLFFTTYAFSAGREITTFRVKVSSTDNPGAPRGAQAQLGITCQNLSSVNQTVTVSLLDESLYFHLCLANPVGMTGWEHRDAAACHYAKTIDIAKISGGSRQQTFRLTPLGTEKDEFNWNPAFTCMIDPNFTDLKKLCDDDQIDYLSWQFNAANEEATGVARCRDKANAPIPNCITSSDASFSTKMRVAVAEDKGAVICSFFAKTHLPYGKDADVGQMTFALNGGRPF